MQKGEAMTEDELSHCLEVRLYVGAQLQLSKVWHSP